MFSLTYSAGPGAAPAAAAGAAASAASAQPVRCTGSTGDKLSAGPGEGAATVTVPVTNN